MSHSRQTQHYGLPLYNGSDIINPLTDFNNGNEAIDEAIYDANENAADAKTIAQTAAGNVSQYDSRIASLETDMSAFNASVDATQNMIAPAFNPLKVDGYNDGDKVIYDNKYYEFIRNHSGAWNASDVKEITVSDIIGEGGSDYDARITAAQNTADAAVTAAAVADGKAVVADTKAENAQSDATRALEEIAAMGGDEWEDVFCIIRKVNGAWEIIDDENHTPMHVEGVSIDNNGYLRVRFDKTYEKCGCAFVTDDETFGINGGVYGVTLAKDGAGILGGLARPVSGVVKINNVNGTCSLVSGLVGDLKSVELLSNGYFHVKFADRIAGFTPVAASIVNVGGGSIYTGGYTITIVEGGLNIVPLASTGGDVMVSVIATIPFTNFADYPDNPTANLFFYAKMKKSSE